MEATVTVQPKELHQLIAEKFVKAGLKKDQADVVANHLVYADAKGIHSHGAVRVDYYAERIAKGGINTNPDITFEKTGPSSGIVQGDNGMGHYVALEGLNHAIDLCKESGVAVVGLRKVSHTGTMAYYVQKAAEENLVAISVCQSDPMVVPFGGSGNYFGTNPIGFAFPRENGSPIAFDMATTVQAWGKVLDARSKNQSIPDTWAVDAQGNPTTDPYNVRGLLPIAGPKGYGLMMMVDILSGMMLGLPFGKHVSSMYDDLSKGRDLGHLYILIDPARFTDLTSFKQNVETMVDEIHSMTPADGFDQVSLPSERSQKKYERNMENGIPIEKNIYEYLKSEKVHFDQYSNKNAFAEEE
ncbi:ureidoglycolate dehydrogenase [Tetragenococcus osmophilus]|uniref:Ureidoglycolate dehydrogenase n=1 Tax=Tetragenococcus osmophilus TaxID=526944 RepID=A0AA38CX02_9ENTE|nr:ureidoglycolate dehydrogenase [Tetragenococcus osmophilus]AYW47227.1 ureidoglycolate dehydrogenase [Tetragenococcus osmophilus]GMA52741.1 ureidoglycolate dehydrogenase [Alicyclobacillus contaminans]GMA73253.1 ureidoglycolate dehydrogenase [Tetragenococcus osmophilus]